MHSPRYDQTEDAGTRRNGLFGLLIVIALTIVFALLASHHKLLWVDELLVLETDSLPTARDVVYTQMHTPIALDPGGYHLAVHGFLKLFGNTALGLRLPSLVGFLCMQVCLFFAVRRMAGSRAATVALLLTLVSGTFSYSFETRPYGMLLGCFGLALLSYCRCATPERMPRTAWLVLLAMAIGLAINTHYFGILLLAPIAIAEAVRLLERRRADVPLWTAVVVGAACYLFTKPFQPGALRYRQHYYNAGVVEIHAIIRSFRLILLNLQFSPMVQRASSVAMFAFCMVCFVVPLVLLVRRRTGMRPCEYALLLSLALLPFIGAAVGRFVTHSFEVRYVLGAVLGYCALFAVAAAPLLRRTGIYLPVVTAMVLCVLGLNVWRVHALAVDARNIQTTLQLSGAQRAMLLSGDDPHIYLQNGGSFQQIAWYLHDPEIRPRLTLLYGFPQEMRYAMRDTNSLTSDNMRAFTGFQIASWDQVFAQPGEHRVLLMHSVWDWVPELLKDPAQHARVRDLGPALGGELYGVTIEAPAK